MTPRTSPVEIDLLLQGRATSFALSETLKPIEGGEFRRTVGGALRYLSDPGARKYTYGVSGEGTDAPSLGGVHPGDTVTVVPSDDALLPHRVLPGDAAVTLARDPAFGSVRVVDPDTYVEAACGWNGRDVTLVVPAVVPLLVLYRPVLTCLVSDVRVERDVDGAWISWSLACEEV